MAKITAIEMARKAKIDPKQFLAVLRDENFDWHKRNDRWTVEIGSEEHRAIYLDPVIELADFRFSKQSELGSIWVD